MRPDSSFYKFYANVFSGDSVPILIFVILVIPAILIPKINASLRAFVDFRNSSYDMRLLNRQNHKNLI